MCTEIRVNVYAFVSAPVKTITCRIPTVIVQNRIWRLTLYRIENYLEPLANDKTAKVSVVKLVSAVFTKQKITVLIFNSAEYSYGNARCIRQLKKTVIMLRRKTFITLLHYVYRRSTSSVAIIRQRRYFLRIQIDSQHYRLMINSKNESFFRFGRIYF